MFPADIRPAADEPFGVRKCGGSMKNKHLRLSIAIALLALSFSLLVLSTSDERAESSSSQETPNRTLRIESVAPGARR